MQRIPKILALMSATIFLAAFAHGATITGTVKGPDGAPFKGAFVQAQNTKTKITVNVLSHKDGGYRVEDLPAGEYVAADSRRWVSGRPAHGRHADGESIRVHGLGAETGDGALARSFAISRRKVDPEYSRQGNGLRPHVQFPRRALPNLPRLSNAHGFRDPRS